MSESTGGAAAPGGEGGATGTPSPPASTPGGAVLSGKPQQQAQPDPLADHDDGLFEVKDGDPAWVKRLRTQGATYRTRAREVAAERDDWKGKYEKVVADNETRTATELARTRETVAKKHGLWDEKGGKDGKGGLLPGIELGSGTVDEMEATATAIVSRFRAPASGGGGRRPVTVTGTTSGTSAQSPSETGRAAEALREFMRTRPGRSTE